MSSRGCSPKGTNTEKPAHAVCEEDRWMTARNKWLLTLPARMVGARGLTGENIDIESHIR
ncbi:MAG: hypothetical protein ACLTDS_01585 [Bianqueaceae bacterium]